MSFIGQNKSYIEIALLSYVIIALIISLFYLKMKKDKKGNPNRPFYYVAIFMMVGEWVVKTIVCFINKEGNATLIPFDICGIGLITAAMAIFSKKDSFLYRSGYTLTYIISFVVAMLVLITPGSIFTNDLTDKKHSVYVNLGGIIYHMCLTFCFIGLMITRPYKIRHRDICYASLIGMGILTVVTLLGGLINVRYPNADPDVDWAEILHHITISFGPIDNLEGTVGYPIIRILFYGTLVLAGGYIGKYVIDIYFPKFVTSSNNGCIKHIYKPMGKIFKK